MTLDGRRARQQPGATLLVRRAGAQCLVQDLGRPGWAHLGVPRSGALDGPSAALANRIVGNPADAAVLEVVLGGLEAVVSVATWMAVAGARVEVVVDGRAVAHGAAVRVPAGGVVRLGRPAGGLRSYLAVAGGVAVPPVLGSRSSDVLAGVGPAPVADGTVLPLGPPTGSPRHADVVRGPAPGPLRIDQGPRSDWFVGDPVGALCAATWTVRPESDRVGLRLDGPVLERSRDDELPSEGMVLGAVQVPPDGRPVVFLADHPPTGGYPVVAVVRSEDLWQCAQLRPGETVRFARAGKAVGASDLSPAR